MIDMTGEVYEHLTAIRYVGDKMWLFRCSCGAEKIISGRSVRDGRTRSCGCLHREQTIASNIRRSDGRCKTLTHDRWRAMMDRAGRDSSVRHEYHGGRGIKVCERWLDYNNFLEDMGECPKGMWLDRFPNNDGNYEPGNCRWATPKESANNQRHGNQWSRA